jgi:hypothetical protein
MPTLQRAMRPHQQATPSASSATPAARATVNATGVSSDEPSRSVDASEGNATRARPVAASMSADAVSKDFTYLLPPRAPPALRPADPEFAVRALAALCSPVVLALCCCWSDWDVPALMLEGLPDFRVTCSYPPCPFDL